MDDPRRLRDPRVVKLLAVAIAAVLASSMIGLVKFAGIGRGDGTPSSSATAGAIRGNSDGSRMLIQGWEGTDGWDADIDSKGWDDNGDSDGGWSSSVEVSSKKSKCVKSGGWSGTGAWSAGSVVEGGGKAGKGRRRLGDGWGSRVWTAPAPEDETLWKPQSWGVDDDCDESADDDGESTDVLYFVKSGKAVKSKSGKSKSGKSKLSVKSKSSKTTLATTTTNTNGWPSSSEWNPPSETTDRTWSAPWTPTGEPSWGTSKPSKPTNSVWSNPWTSPSVPSWGSSKPSKPTESAWSNPWTPPREPSWGSRKWTTSPSTTTPSASKPPTPPTEVFTRSVS